MQLGHFSPKSGDPHPCDWRPASACQRLLLLLRLRPAGRQVGPPSLRYTSANLPVNLSGGLHRPERRANDGTTASARTQSVRRNKLVLSTPFAVVTVRASFTYADRRSSGSPL